MGNLLVEDKNIKSSVSNFSIYPNEEIRFEGKNVSQTLFAYKIQTGFFKAIDIEIINAVYILKYATSRQVTTFLNFVRNVDVKQSYISNRLTKLNNASVIARYSFFSDEREHETGLKCYVLCERGKRLLIQREYDCTWNVMNSAIVLEDIKNYLARNNYLLKLISSGVVNYSQLKIDNESMWVQSNYKINNIKHTVLSLRKTNNLTYLEKFLIKNNLQGINSKIILIGETDLHLFELYKQILTLIQNKILEAKILNLIVFTQDLRIIEKDIDSCFIIYKLNGSKVTLEDCKLNELTKNL